MNLEPECINRLVLLLCQHWQGRYLRRSLQGLDSASQFFDLTSLEQQRRLSAEAYELLSSYTAKRHESQIGDKLKCLLRRCEADSVRLLFSHEIDFPPLLRETTDCPELLFVSGSVEALHWPQLAVVGSRKASASGIKQAEQISWELSAAGLGITSGLALGIDAAAHRGAIKAKGKTIAVLGSGLDQLYPRRNLALSQQILAEGGAVISEYPFGAPPKPAHFPKRNRIVTGLALGTLVVEAAERSGSLISASLALEENREVFAIPGSINNPLSRGCHRLIKQGAILVENTRDIAEHLSGSIQGQLSLIAPLDIEAKDTHPESDRSLNMSGLLKFVGFDPISLDEIQIQSGLTADEITVQLMELELAGRVSQQAGLYQRLK